jgi:hypothetical protein
MTLAEAATLMKVLFKELFPEQDYGLSGRFASYLSMSRDHILRIFLLDCRIETELEVIRFLSEPYNTALLIQDLHTLPLDIQICLLDRLHYGYKSLADGARYKAKNPGGQRHFPFPSVLIRSCIDLYEMEEMSRWFSCYNGLPWIIFVGPSLVKKANNP